MPILLVFVILLGVWIVLLTVKYRRLKHTFRRYKKALRKVSKTLNSVRYGNIYETVDKETRAVLPNFSESIEKMLESFIDRESMIKEFQNDLSRQIEAQKEIQKLKEDFVATLTHDLKVPIIAENNMLNFLLENRFGELSDRQKEAVFHLKNSNKELIELVEILLETYKLNETDINLTKENIDINRLIQRVIEEMQPICDTNSISMNLHSEYSADLSIDGFYIKRVLKNIVLNAISFSNPNSHIDIAVRSDCENAVIEIKNYGKTISKKDMEHIFDKYYSTANKFRKVGTGLGLYLSNKIVKAHEGSIFARPDNEENSTTMVIQLPQK